MKMQISKYIAHSGVCSRRKADELIMLGDISINGEAMTNPAYRLQEDDVVTYKGRVIAPEQHVYVIINKPKGYICTVADEKNRKTVLDLVPVSKNVRLYPVGRLDRSTTGLLLMTNDGAFAQKMAHPRNSIVKRYKVTLDRPLSVSLFERIKKGLRLDDGFIKPDSLIFVAGSKRMELLIELHSGRNRIIRRLFGHVEYKVTKLDRFYYAGLTKHGLARGAFRHLTQAEVEQLYQSS